MCAGLGGTLYEPARPPKAREYEAAKDKDGNRIPKADQAGYRYGETPWSVTGRIVHIRSHAPILVYGEDLYGSENNLKFIKEGQSKEGNPSYRDSARGH